MRRVSKLLLLCVSAFALLLSTQPAGAITYGSFDGNRHPEVGAMVAEWREAGVKDLFCSGTLIAPTVFLTASHCTYALENSFGVAPDEVWVTFDPTYQPGTSPIIHGTYHTNPNYGGGESDTGDIAVVVLDRAPAGVTPARLPRQGLLSRLKAAHTLDDKTFTAVGYGTIRESQQGGFQGILDNSERRFVAQSSLSLIKAWLTLSMNPATGNGGTCYGDSGGPHFLGGSRSNLVVSLTVTGDAVCKATDTTYRVDTAPARAFLEDFVELP